MKFGELDWTRYEGSNWRFCYAYCKKTSTTYSIMEGADEDYKYKVRVRYSSGKVLATDSVLELSCWLEDKEPGQI